MNTQIRIGLIKGTFLVVVGFLMNASFLGRFSLDGSINSSIALKLIIAVQISLIGAGLYSIYAKRQEKILLKELVFRLIVVLVTISMVIGVLAYFHREWTKQLEGYARVGNVEYNEPVFPELNQQQILNIGYAHTPDDYSPKSSYLYFDKNKEDGKIRIGVFGCSYVRGAEVAFGYDFPTLLGDLFSEYGYSSVEVINFGVGGFGMHQTLMMWEYLGKQYNLDYAILNPDQEHKRRDNAFNYYHKYHLVHARYILAEDSLQLVPVAGNTRSEVRRNYFSFFQPWNYIKYDRYLPHFLHLFLPSHLTNPFYYYPNGDGTEWNIFLNNMYARMGGKTNLIVINNHNLFEKNYAVTSDEMDIHFMKTNWEVPYKLSPSLYKAPKGHISATGNKFRAEELFSCLTNNPITLKYIRFYPIPDSIYEVSEDIQTFDEFYFKLDDVALSSLIYRRGQDEFEPAGKFDKNIKSLLFLSYSYSDLTFAPLPFHLSEESPVFLAFNLEGEELKLEIGSVKSHSHTTGSISWFSHDTLFVTRNFKFRFMLDGTALDLRSMIVCENSPNHVRIELEDGTELSTFSLSRKTEDATLDVSGYKLKLDSKSVIRLRSGGEEYIDVDNVHPGYLYIHITDGDYEVDIPFFRYELDSLLYDENILEDIPIILKPDTLVAISD